MNPSQKQKIEFGDFQTPYRLAVEVCEKLAALGISPDVVLEPTCGVGAFVLAAAKVFPHAREIHGFDINAAYLATLSGELPDVPGADRIRLMQGDFFAGRCIETLRQIEGSLLVLGNFPWVTNSGQGLIGGNNLPHKSNFHGRKGIHAITGTGNFDISEWMLLEVLKWLERRSGDLAMLVKTSVARKVLAEVERLRMPVRDAFLVKIDARKEFAANVEAALLVIRICQSTGSACYDYTMFERMSDACGARVGQRRGYMVSNLEAFERCQWLLGASPQKWRSGIKHDASAVMEFARTGRGLLNGLGEVVDLEDDYLFPLCKGSDIGSDKAWRERYVLVPQRHVGERTEQIQGRAPRTWQYLMRHAGRLDARRSAIYRNNPRFSIFGVGEYAFRPWRIAICALYKKLAFTTLGPVDNRPVMFDDTVYFLSFHSEAEAEQTLQLLNSAPAKEFLSSLIFWDDKRPIKTSILNLLDFHKIFPLK